LKHQIEIFEYSDYRKYLKDVYLYNKSLNPKYSYRYFARAAGYSSASALLEVINGKKNLSIEGSEKFAKALKLNQSQAHFFKTLVLFNQCLKGEERIMYAKEINRLKLNNKIFSLEEIQYKLFERWYYTAIIEMVTFPGFSEDPRWIAKHVVPTITPQQAKSAVSELLKLGLLRRDENNKLVQGMANVTTPDEVSSTYVANWHRECMQKAAESLDTMPREKRDISGVYFSLAQENIKAIKELLHKFRRDILELASQEQVRDSVYQLNLQLFPVAEANAEEDNHEIESV
jgi:uncharacterized protein (TIGR02147 family)